MYRKKFLFWICCVFFLAGCSQFNELYKKKPTVGLSLPHAKQQEVATATADSVSEPPKEIVFVRSDGEQVSLNVSAEWDSVHKENMTSVALDEVVISAQTRRNTAERDGKINVEFVVTVPVELQQKNWMVDVIPMLKKGEVETDSLKEIRFTGSAFRQKQESDYQRYDRFLEGIIPDSVNFYRTFVNYHAFERYLDRLNFQKQALERRVAFLEAKRKRPDALLKRLEAFNRRMKQKDSLLYRTTIEKADSAVARKQRTFMALEEQVMDTVRYRPAEMLRRFNMFNEKSRLSQEKLAERIARHKAQALERVRKDSLRRMGQIELSSGKVINLVDRKTYFHNLAVSKAERARKKVKMKGGLPPRVRERFEFFNERMQEKKGKLYYRYRVKAAKKEGDEQLGALKAFVAGKDTAQYLNREGLLEKYTRKYEKVKESIPMYNMERPLDDSTYIASLSKRAKRLRGITDYSPKEIEKHYTQGIRPTRTLQAKDTVYRPPLWERVAQKIPKRKLRRELMDSVYYVKPSERLLKRYEMAKFDSAAVVAKYMKEYERQRDKHPLHDLEKAHMKVNAKKAKIAEKQQLVKTDIERIASIDSTELVKRFYNTQKIARNEARKAKKDDKFHDLVRFPYNPAAKLDTMIYAADKVYYLYSEKIPADENTSRLYVYLNGSVVDHMGNNYELPSSDTLTYFVSSMTKFVDETPRYVQRVVTRDAEASTKVNFTFPSGKSRLDRELGNNEQELARVKKLTSELMTDPVYIIDSLTLYAGSSPEGNWAVNEKLSRERAESIRKILVQDFKILYDSLNISMAVMLDDQGNVMTGAAAPELPNLPELLKVRWSAENWAKLAALIEKDEKVENRAKILELILAEKHPDNREYLIRHKYPKDYAYIREKLYPEVRSVDFLFSLHRRGMQKDTLYTTELDREYANGVEFLKKRNYEKALEVLRPYEDVNTAIAYMSLGYDRAAIRILNRENERAEVRYLQAILEYRLGDEKQAVLCYMRAYELDDQLKHRGNLDPELSTLIKKYDLFKEDDVW